MVLITTTCPDGSVGQGTGVMVSEDTVVTALHVVGCQLAPGIPIYFDEPTKIEVLGDVGVVTTGTVELEITHSDIARIRLKDHSLAEYFTPVRVGPPPRVGERLCIASALPRVTYRCGEAQAAPSGRVSFSIMTEHGNSGSAVYDSHGRIVAIVTNLVRCEGNALCAGYGTALAGYSWIVPE